MAVNAEVSVVSAIAGKGWTFFINLPVNSAAKCCASAAEPPLPQIKTLFFFFNVS